jgi:hypothetical protein
MNFKSEVPRTAQTSRGTVETNALEGAGGFVRHDSPSHAARQGLEGVAQARNCNRCGRHAARRGSISALITESSGRRVRKFLCAACVTELRSGIRLIA